MVQIHGWVPPPHLGLTIGSPTPLLQLLAKLLRSKILLYVGRIECAQKEPTNNYTILYVWWPALFMGPQNCGYCLIKSGYKEHEFVMRNLDNGLSWDWILSIEWHVSWTTKENEPQPALTGHTKTLYIIVVENVHGRGHFYDLEVEWGIVTQMSRFIDMNGYGSTSGYCENGNVVWWKLRNFLTSCEFMWTKEPLE